MATAKPTTRTAGPELLTANDLLSLHEQGVRGELVRGVFTETMPAGHRHGKVVARLTRRLGNFVEPQNLGELTASDAGVSLGRNPDTVREPDIAYFSTQKIPPGTDIPGYSEVVPDLVVEVVSPSNTHREVSDKALMWLHFGVSLVWVVDSNRRVVEVHREGHEVATLNANDALDGLDVLPGFSCAVSDIFHV